MLRQRVITALTLNDGVLFRTKKFVPDYRYTLNFVDAWSVDEIVVLDITRTGEGNRENFLSIVSDLAKRCFVPLAVGGGVRTMDDFKTLLAVGADKVVVNTGAFENPNLITQAAKLFGAQCVVLSIDAKRNEDGTYEVFTHFGKNPTGMSPVEWAKKGEALGAGEIFITSIDKDGSLEGYDNELCRQVSEAVEIPVIICGGAGKWQDFVDGFQEGRASAVATVNIYHFTESSIKNAKKFLQNAGVLVRA